MAKPRPKVRLANGRASRVRLTADESLKRMKGFSERKEDFIAAVRKGKNRSLSA